MRSSESRLRFVSGELSDLGALPDVVDVAAPRSISQRARDVVAHRSLLANLVRRDLRVRYKGSVLGFFWSLLNPAMYLVVFSFVFTVFLPARVPLFGIFMLSGLLIWNFFNGSLAAASNSIVENRALVQKVWFPREILPLAALGSALINMFLQAVVLVIGSLAFQNAPDVRALPLVLYAVIATAVLAAGLGILLSALTVEYRDVSHLLDVGMTAWFWMSAVVFPFGAVAVKLGENQWLAFLNPMLAPILAFQRALYDPAPSLPGETPIIPEESLAWYYGRVSITLAIGVVILFIALRVFARREDSFGDQL